MKRLASWACRSSACPGCCPAGSPPDHGQATCGTTLARVGSRDPQLRPRTHRPDGGQVLSGQSLGGGQAQLGQQRLWAGEGRDPGYVMFSMRRGGTLAVEEVPSSGSSACSKGEEGQAWWFARQLCKSRGGSAERIWAGRTPRQPSAKTTNPTCREGCVGGRQHGGHQVGVAQLLGGAGSLHAGCDWGAVRVRSGSRWARNGSGWAGRASNLRKAVQTAQLAASAAVCRGQGQTGQETGPVCPLVRQGKRWLRYMVHRTTELGTGTAQQSTHAGGGHQGGEVGVGGRHLSNGLALQGGRKSRWG